LLFDGKRGLRAAFFVSAPLIADRPVADQRFEHTDYACYLAGWTDNFNYATRASPAFRLIDRF